MKVVPLSNVDGSPVDWWFQYKLPKKVGPKKDSTGFEFIYYDADSKGPPEMSKVSMDEDQAASAQTLKQIFGDDPNTGYVLWNDEIPPTHANPKPEDDGGKGHSKGILAFNKQTDSGLYLLHSTPRFPVAGEIDLPDDEKIYGQTYLCVSLKGYETANQIAEVLRCQNEVQAYASKLPGVEKTESLAKLAVNDNSPIPKSPEVLKFETQGGTGFQLLAKNKRWSEPSSKGKGGKDFWKDFVGPTLNCDLDVETWRRGVVFDDVDSGSKHTSMDVLDIDLGPAGYDGYQWAFTKDHAKWGISVKKTPGFVVIADINRQESQENRGGGGLVFKSPAIWNFLKEIEIVESTVEKKPHKDQQ